jgi:hypothetical protein
MFIDVVKHYRFLNLGAKTMDRFGQEFRTLISPTGLFRAWIQVNQLQGSGLQIIVMDVWQDFEDSAPSAQQHKCFIHDDGSQPGRESRLFLKAIEMKKSLVKTLLHRIFGIFPVVRYPLRRGKDSSFVT